MLMDVGVCQCCFFKQKTAYEMRISDLSSDVCSSDLHLLRRELVAIFTIGEHPVRAEYRIAAEERHHDERERRQPGPPQQHGKGRTLRHRMILKDRKSVV